MHLRWPPARNWPLRALERDVLEGRGVGEARDQAESRLADTGADAVEEAQLPNWGVNRFLVDELLHLVEDRGALLVIEFVGLLRKELVDVGVAAIGVGAALDDERGQPRRRIPKGAARALNDAARV